MGGRAADRRLVQLDGSFGSYEKAWKDMIVGLDLDLEEERALKYALNSGMSGNQL